MSKTTKLFKDLPEELQEELIAQRGAPIAPDTPVIDHACSDPEEIEAVLLTMLKGLDRFEALNMIGDLLHLLMRKDTMPVPPEGMESAAKTQLFLTCLENIRSKRAEEEVTAGLIPVATVGNA